MPKTADKNVQTYLTDVPVVAAVVAAAAGIVPRGPFVATAAAGGIRGDLIILVVFVVVIFAPVIAARVVRTSGWLLFRSGQQI